MDFSLEHTGSNDDGQGLHPADEQIAFGGLEVLFAVGVVAFTQYRKTPPVLALRLALLGCNGSGSRQSSASIPPLMQSRQIVVTGQTANVPGQTATATFVVKQIGGEMKEAKKFVLFFVACYILVFSLVLPPFALAQAPQHFITVGWTFNQGTNTDIAAGFDVYRSTVSNGPYSQINTTIIPISALTYNDNGPGVAGTKYFYVIDSVDLNGVHSGYSPETSATWVNSTPPNPMVPTATAH